MTGGTESFKEGDWVGQRDVTDSLHGFNDHSQRDLFEYGAQLHGREAHGKVAHGLGGIQDNAHGHLCKQPLQRTGRRDD